MVAGSNVVALPGASGEPTLGDAIEDYFVDVELSAGTVETYGRTFEAMVEHFGSDYRLDRITRGDLDAFLKQRWGDAAATTFNRNKAAVGSLFSWCEDVELIPLSPARKLRRRKEKVTFAAERRQRPIPFDDLKALWSDHRAHHVRDRALWVMLYETAARANEVLGLDIENLDLANKHGVTIAKGGSVETLVWASTTARLLPRIIDGRTSGPLFLTHRLPRSHVLPAASDICPATGRARLSYRQAEDIFKTASDGKTLHQLRHAALTHLAEEGRSLLEIQAKSRHTSVRSLARYVNPSLDMVKRLTNETDPNRRTGTR